MKTSWAGDELLVSNGEKWAKYSITKTEPGSLKWPIRLRIIRVARDWQHEWTSVETEDFFEAALEQYRSRYGNEI